MVNHDGSSLIMKFIEIMIFRFKYTKHDIFLMKKAILYTLNYLKQLQIRKNYDFSKNVPKIAENYFE